MKIYRNTTEIADVYLSKYSYTNEEINGEFIAYLEFDSRWPVNLTINDWIGYRGNKYYIRHKENVEKKETSLGYSYRIKLYHDMYRMHDVSFFLYGKPEFKKNFNTYIGTARDVLGFIVDSMNRDSSGWSVGECIESDPMTFNFVGKSCAEVASDVINVYNTELWVSGRTVNFGKREYSSNGLVLSQGEGFVNLIVSAVDETPPITRLYAYGSDKNITKEYGDYLSLPGGSTCIEKNVDKYGIIEYQKQFEEIFPKGEFYVTEKIDDFTLRSSDIDFNLTEQLIDDVEVIVTFQTGGLAGYDLAIVEGSWDNSNKQFKLKKNQQENDLNVPGDINFDVGDKFILTGLKMPQSYIDKAEQELLKEAQEWLDQKCENRIQLKGECDEINFYERDIHIACGQLVGVYNQRLEIDREIRVTKLRRYIENDDETPYRYEITLSDFLDTNPWGQVVEEIKKIPDRIEKGDDKNLQYTKRRWRDAEEHLSLIEYAIKGFEKGINPIWVKTMSILLGDETLQFRFVNNKTNPVAIDSGISYSNLTKRITAPKSIIQHMSLGINSLSPSHSVNEYSFWDLPSYNNPIEGTEAGYFYAVCSKSNSAGYFMFSKTPHDFDNKDGNYYMLVGTLSSEENGERSYVETYGFTEILPGRMTIHKIIDPDGYQYWDMLNKAFRIGDANNHLAYNTDGDNRLILKGTLVQSPGGSLNEISIYRGDYSPLTRYFRGESVSFDNGTHRCKKDTPDAGYDPTNTEYWEIEAKKGADGEPGDRGPGIIFRGDYNLLTNAERVFYNNTNRRDVVYYNASYYAYDGTDGQLNTTWVPERWASFGAQFSSVATNLLLAEYANIAGWIYRNGRMEAQNRNALLDGREDADIRIALGNNATENAYGANLKIYDNGDIAIGKKASLRLSTDASGNGSVFISAENDMDNRVELHMTDEGYGRLFVGQYLDGGFGTTGSYFTKEGLEIMLRSNTICSMLFNEASNQLNIIFNRLPTSDYGLSYGSLWRDSNGYLRIV